MRTQSHTESYMIRRRAAAGEGGDVDAEHLVVQPRVISSWPSRPSAKTLLASTPTHKGYLEKRRERCLGLAPRICTPKWQRRLFIVSGGYIFRYRDEDSLGPKGAPIPVESARVELNFDWDSDLQ